MKMNEYWIEICGMRMDAGLLGDVREKRTAGPI
jgi:hypothetical protein